jgi:hypothetical protein
MARWLRLVPAIPHTSRVRGGIIFCIELFDTAISHARGMLNRYHGAEPRAIRG